MKEIRALTSLRAMAAFLVFMVHYAWGDTPANRGVSFSGEWVPLLPLWRQGQVGVSIFYVLSGFLLMRLYFDQLQNHNSSLRLYIVKRIARIWPLFLLFATLQHLLLIMSGHGIDFGAIITMTMTQGFFVQLHDGGLPTAWSLTIEECFYLCLPWMIIFIARVAPGLNSTHRQERQRALWKVGLILMSLIGLFLVVGLAAGQAVRALGWDWQGFLGSNFLIWHKTLFGRFFEFAAGMFVAFLHRDYLLEKILTPIRATLLVGIALLGLEICMWSKAEVAFEAGRSAQMWTYVLTLGHVFFTALLITGLTVRGGPIHRFFSLGLFVYLGRISYGFYLIQMTEMIRPLLWLTDQFGYFRLPALYILANFVCMICFELVEKPARRSIIERWGGRTSP